METVPHSHISVYRTAPTLPIQAFHSLSHCNVYVAERERKKWKSRKIERNWENKSVEIERKKGRKKLSSTQHTIRNVKLAYVTQLSVRTERRFSLWDFPSLSHALFAGTSVGAFPIFSFSVRIESLRVSDWKFFREKEKKWKLMRKRDISSFKRRENEHWIVDNYRRLLKLHNYMWKVERKKISRFLGESSRKASHTVLEFEER